MKRRRTTPAPRVKQELLSRINKEVASITSSSQLNPEEAVILLNAPTAVDQYSTSVITLPIIRPNAMTDEEVVIPELLWVDYYFGVSDATDQQTTKAVYLSPVRIRTSDATSTVSSVLDDLSDTRVIGGKIVQKILTTSGATTTQFPLTYNFQDSTGKGYLWGAQNMWVTSADIANTSTERCVARVHYRWTAVTLLDYMNIVQNQTGSVSVVG